MKWIEKIHNCFLDTFLAFLEIARKLEVFGHRVDKCNLSYREDQWCSGFLDTNFRFAQVLLENRIQSVFE